MTRSSRSQRKNVPARSKFFPNKSQVRVNDVNALIQQGMQEHQAGHLDKAKKIYDIILGKDPLNYDALNLSGVILLQLNDPTGAISLIERAINVLPNQAMAHVNHGLALDKLEKLNLAIDCFDRAISLNPNFAEAYNNKGITLKKLNRFEEALSAYEQAISLKDNYAVAYSNLGNVLRELQRYEDALPYFKRAIDINSNYAEAYSNLGVTLCELGRFEEALLNHDRAISLVPSFAEAYTNRGITLEKLNRFNEALASHNMAIDIRPDYADAFANKGVVLAVMGSYDEAINSYRHALEIMPTHIKSLSNLGVAYKETMKFDLAMESYNHAIQLNENYADAFWNKSLLLLLLGDYANGWALYEWRWKRNEFAQYRRKFSKPLWIGEPSIVGKSIFLYSEQGLGDTIQFCRYAKLLQNLGAKVFLEVPSQLFRLLKSLDGVEQLIESGNVLPNYDFYCPLLSLPLALSKTYKSIPKTRKYIHAEKGKLSIWSEILGEKKQLRVGLVWSGNSSHANDQKRSLLLNDFMQYLPSGVDYVSLQKEVRLYDIDTLKLNQIRHFGDQIVDFSDTAALCELMDLVVSVDTSVAHLSGAMGKDTFVLLPYIPDWRWLLTRNDSPWYSTIRLFRQNSDRKWAPVLQEVAKYISTISKINK